MSRYGFEFVGFSAPQANVSKPLFEKNGLLPGGETPFEKPGALPPGPHQLHRPAQTQKAGPTAAQGLSACGLVFRVKDAHKACACALALGYRVTYRLDGQQGTVRTSFKPGATLPVKNGEVVLTPSAPDRS